MFSVGREIRNILRGSAQQFAAAELLVFSAEGSVIGVLSLLVVDGVVETVYLMANPEKMAHV